jgi:predicted ester cyclase
MDHKEIVKHFYEHVVSHHCIDEVDAFVSEGCTVRIGTQIVPAGIDGMKQHLVDIRKTYPDYTMTIIRQYEDGDDVISEFIMEGTHRGTWLGMKPTNKKLSFTGVDIDKVIDGKITEHGGAVNTFETLFAEKIIQPV